VAILPLEAY